MICLSVYRDDVWSCVNGHLSCGDCRGKVDYCAECRDQLGYDYKCPAHLRMISKMPVKCDECEEEVLHENYLKHKATHIVATDFEKYFNLHANRRVRVLKNGIELGVITLPAKHLWVNEESVKAAGLTVTRERVAGEMNDVYTCQTCKVQIINFAAHDIPLVEHMKFSPQCNKVLEVVGNAKWIPHDVEYQVNGDVHVNMKPYSTCPCPYNFRDARAFVMDDHPTYGKLLNIVCAGSVLEHRQYARYEGGLLMTLRQCHEDDWSDDFVGASDFVTDARARDVCSCGSIMHEIDHYAEGVPFVHNVAAVRAVEDAAAQLPMGIIPVRMPGEDLVMLAWHPAVANAEENMDVVDAPIRGMELPLLDFDESDLEDMYNATDEDLMAYADQLPLPPYNTPEPQPPAEGEW